MNSIKISTTTITIIVMHFKINNNNKINSHFKTNIKNKINNKNLWSPLLLLNLIKNYSKYLNMFLLLITIITNLNNKDLIIILIKMLTILVLDNPHKLINNKTKIKIKCNKVKCHLHLQEIHSNLLKIIIIWEKIFLLHQENEILIYEIL